jgi:UDP-GlcNAc:undecaprenyl-phosphate GlcNAc-1-phosphate transferase
MASLVALAVGFAASAALMPVIIRLSLRMGFTDQPGALKVHHAVVPVLGGVGIFAGAAVALGAARGAPAEAGPLAIALGVLALGAWDDLRNLPPRARLAAHSVAAAATLAIGLRVGTFPAAIVAVPLTAVLVVGAINAVNLFDGLDGLAGGTASLSLLGFAAMLHRAGGEAAAIVALAVAGAVLGFLLFNFNPARVFMGDNGSTFLGYVLAVLAIHASARPWDVRALAAALLVIGLPIVDTAAAIVRRALERRPIFAGDRSHIYDRLVDRGFSVRQTALLCWAIQALLVTAGLLVAGV